MFSHTKSQSQQGKSHLSLKKSALSCNECKKTFKTKSGLNLHLRYHLPEKYLLRCDYCDFTSFQKANFCKHIAVKHKKNLDGQSIVDDFTCHLCEYKCVLEDQLKAHMSRKHTTHSKKEFKCNECEYATVEKAALEKHIRIRHTKQRPYSCDDCRYRAHTASGMARHRRSHERIKPYRCSICSLCYADKKRLKEHCMKHSNERPFSCTSCKYSTNRRDNLKLHIKRNHLETTQITLQIPSTVSNTDHNNCGI